MTPTTIAQNISVGMTQGETIDFELEEYSFSSSSSSDDDDESNTNKRPENIKKYMQVNRLCIVKGLGNGIADMILDAIAYGSNIRDGNHNSGARGGFSWYNNAFIEELEILGWSCIRKDKKIDRFDRRIRHVLTRICSDGEGNIRWKELLLLCSIRLSIM